MSGKTYLPPQTITLPTQTKTRTIYGIAKVTTTRVQTVSYVCFCVDRIRSNMLTIPQYYRYYHHFSRCVQDRLSPEGRFLLLVLIVLPMYRQGYSIFVSVVVFLFVRRSLLLHDATSLGGFSGPGAYGKFTSWLPSFASCSDIPSLAVLWLGGERERERATARELVDTLACLLLQMVMVGKIEPRGNSGMIIRHYAVQKCLIHQIAPGTRHQRSTAKSVRCSHASMHTYIHRYILILSRILRQQMRHKDATSRIQSGWGTTESASSFQPPEERHSSRGREVRGAHPGRPPSLMSFFVPSPSRGP